MRRGGVAYALVDAVSDEDLQAIGRAVADLPLITAASGVALGLRQNFPESTEAPGRIATDRLRDVRGPAVIISGCCSTLTNTQVARAG